MNTTQYWIEIRPTVRRSGSPLLVPLEHSAQYRGFRSVFAYDEATKESIREMNGTSHLRGMPVYADTVFVDFDNSDGSDMINYLVEQGIGFEKWHSGGRSIHLHIPMVPAYGSWVPLSIKKWVQARSPKADITFYHNAGLYRLPGTYHYKYPGQCKTLLLAHPGKLLEPARVERKIPIFGAFVLDEGSIENFYFYLTDSKAGEVGNRSPHMWKLCVLGLEAGLEIDVVRDHVCWWNNRFAKPPHGEDTIDKQLEQALLYMQRKTS